MRRKKKQEFFVEIFRTRDWLMMNILNSYLCSLSLLFTETGLIVPSGDTIGTSLRLLFLFQLPNMNGSLWVLFPISKVSEC